MVVTCTPFSSGTRIALLVIEVPPFADTVNEAVPPFCVILAVLGLMAMELMTIKTVAVALELKACALALIEAVPGVTPVRMPEFASTIAIVGVSLDQETPLLI